jgi:Fe-S-cluster containining protein
MDIQRQIKEIEKQAHHGGYGLWRKSFCREYLKLQKEACVEAREELLSYLDSIGQHITCRMGCAHCCSQYISISVSNGIVIVDYLYSNPRVLEKFLRNYEKWLRIMDSGIENTRILRKLEEYTSFSPVVKPTPQDLLTEYAFLQVPCPFIVDSVCIIYPVRPICCASHFSISSPGLCIATSIEQPMICEATPSRQYLIKINNLTELRLSLHQETMPKLVFDLLTIGLPGMLGKLDRLAGASE